MKKLVLAVIAASTIAGTASADSYFCTYTKWGESFVVEDTHQMNPDGSRLKLIRDLWQNKDWSDMFPEGKVSFSGETKRYIQQNYDYKDGKTQLLLDKQELTGETFEQIHSYTGIHHFSCKEIQ